MTAPEPLQAIGVCLRWRHTGERIRPVATAFACPLTADVFDLPVDAADLGKGGPARNRARFTLLGIHRFWRGELGHNFRRDLERAALRAVAMPVAAHHQPLAWRPGVGEAERHCRQRERLVLLQDEEIVPPRIL